MIGEFTAITSAVCWAIGAILYKNAMDEGDIDPISANFVRLIPASTILFLSIWVMGKLWELWYLSLTHLAYLIVGTIIGLGLGDSIYLLALKHAGISRGVAITSTYPFFTFIIESILEKFLDVIKFVAVILILSAIWILSRRESSEEVVDVKKGVFLSVATATIWAAGIVMIDYALRGIDFYIANMIRFPILAVLMGGAILVTGNHRDILELSRRQLTMLTLAGVIALAIGGLTFFASISFIGVAEATALASLSPIFSTILSIASGKEKFSWRIILGVILATTGIIILALIE